MRAHAPCPALAAAIAALWVAAAAADPVIPAPAPSSSTAADHADAIARAHAILRDHLDGVDLDALLPGRQEAGGAALDEARALADAGADILRSEIDRRGAAQASAAAEPAVEPAAEPEVEPEIRYLVLASEAMPSGSRAALAALVEARGDMAVIYRGLAHGETLAAFAERMAGTVGPFAIDPRPFRAHDVAVVPAIVDLRTGRVAFGLIDPGAVGAAADRAVLGPVVAIAEPDLEDALRARVAAIDWSARREAAVRRYWDHAPMQPLTAALEPRTRQVDARFTLAEDFVLPDGQVVARAGDIIDPMALRPFTLTLIVFDGASAAELPIVEAALAAAANPVLIATRIDRLEGWDGLNRLETRLGAPVHMLTPELRARFDLRRTVSVVTGAGGFFIVDERPAGAAGRAEALP